MGAKFSKKKKPLKVPDALLPKPDFSPLPDSSGSKLSKLQNQPNSNQDANNKNKQHRNYRYDSSEPESLVSSFEIGDVVIARYNFEARSDKELDLNQGDKLVLVDIVDQDWVFATHEPSGARGYIPLSYLAHSESLDIFDWYFGFINRREAETLLLRQKSGTFLVRVSTSKPGEFALSLKHFSAERKNHVRHYAITYIDYQYSIWHKKLFNNLQDLVEDYKVNTNGLPILLVEPCRKIRPAMNDISIETRDRWEIDRSEIQLIKVIGQGNFGEVYYGKWKKKFEVAVKTLKKGTMPDEQFLAEATIMKGLKHENILSLFATCSKEEPIYIITQYMENGSLLAILKQNKEGETLSYDQMLEFSFQIAKGMFYLEKKSLIHRDLAARNVLVDDSYTCKIADFGLAKILVETEAHSISSGKFPVKWSPPEVLTEGKFSIKSDVWSFGIVMIEIFTFGDSLYKGMNQKQVRTEVENGYRLPQPPLCPTSIYELLLKCWDHNPQGRPSFKDLKGYFDDSCHKIADGTQYIMQDTD